MSAAVAEKVPTREEIAVEHRWNLEAVYATPEAWEADFARIEELLAPLLALEGKLDSPAQVAKAFALEDALHVVCDRLNTYSHHREDEDTGNTINQGRQQRLRAKMTTVYGRTAWITPEILAQPLETLEAWRTAPELAAYQHTMRVLIRQKPHTLSNAEERLLSMAGEVFGVPHQAFSFLTNADMKFPDVVDENGVAQPLTNGRYITFLEKRDRPTRRRAFEQLYDTYGQFQNTLAATLAGSVKLHNYNATIRHYGSAVEAALAPDNIPVSLYDSLIASVHDALPIFHDYIDLRREVMGLDDLDMHDMYVPIVPNFEMKVEWAKACDWVRDACRPLGDEYVKALERSYSERWIDVYENKGKRSGAYSGGSYTTAPYVLMNYQGTLNWVFTLAHELGHSLHSWLANNAQPYRDSNYTIFVAEIASTTNEMLLHEHLLARAEDPRMKAYLLNHLCEQFRGTVFRQTMFAEFERRIHEMDQRGEPLTADSIGEAYYDLNARFFGPRVTPDRRIAREWSRIPHFYYNFYVYKYATGFCASQVFAQRILAGGEGRAKYLDFLRGGGSADPLDLVKRGGVDLTSTAVLTDAFATFGAAVKELRGLLKG